MGSQFNLRLADIGGACFRHFDPHANYGLLNGLSRNRIRKDLINKHWYDMLRVEGSLKLGKVNVAVQDVEKS
ncbi:Tn3 family transposase [Bacillus sp. MUM 116]|uniref:Tn3 family transposase n=1 Tax=Bacillus sp. MUM 116 TaxID=1678002 RepID=UPI003526C968